MYDATSLTIALAVGLFAVLFLAFVFLLIRQIVLWYLRVNEAIDTLKSIEAILRERLPVQHYPTQNGVPQHEARKVPLTRSIPT